MGVYIVYFHKTARAIVLLRVVLQTMQHESDTNDQISNKPLVEV